MRKQQELQLEEEEAPTTTLLSSLSQKSTSATTEYETKSTKSRVSSSPELRPWAREQRPNRNARAMSAIRGGLIIN